MTDGCHQSIHVEVRQLCVRIAVRQIENLPAWAAAEHRLCQVLIQPLQPLFARESGNVWSWRVGKHGATQQLGQIRAEHDWVFVLAVLLHNRIELTQCITSGGTAGTRARPSAKQEANSN
jgi:hypothetical protein